VDALKKAYLSEIEQKRWSALDALEQKVAAEGARSAARIEHAARHKQTEMAARTRQVPHGAHHTTS
jgi:hypothetical protein